MTKMVSADLLGHCACFDLKKTTRAVTRLYDDWLRVSGLNITQYSMLRMIEAEREISVSTLTRFMVMDQTSITRALAPLARDRLIRSRPGTDKRTRLVSLTNKGKILLAGAKPQWKQAQKALLGLIGRRRWTDMRDALRETTRVVRHNSRLENKRAGRPSQTSKKTKRTLGD